ETRSTTRQFWLLGRRKETERDLPNGDARAQARHPRRNGFGPRHRRPQDRRERRERAPEPGPRDGRHHALPAAPRLHRGGPRPRSGERWNRPVGRQDSGARARARGLRKVRTECGRVLGLTRRSTMNDAGTLAKDEGRTDGGSGASLLSAVLTAAAAAKSEP